jgi:hypothetical protein
MNFKNISLESYPELKDYKSAEIYNRFIGCGGLYLATKMVYYDYIDKKILSMGSIIPQEKLIQQINYGKENSLQPTIFILAGTKR